MPLPWVLPVAVGLFFLASRRGSGSGDETPPVRREGSRAADETPPVRREGSRAADETPPVRRTGTAPTSSAPARRERRGWSRDPAARERHRWETLSGVPIDRQNVTASRVRAAEQAAVALALDAQRTGTGGPSQDTIMAAQERTQLPRSGAFDQTTRRGLARLIAGPLAQRASPARSPRHYAARMVASAYLLPAEAQARPTFAATMRQQQAALGVPQTGTLDQTTAAAAVTELARET